MKETRGSFRPKQETVVYQPYFRKGSFIASIIFLGLALTKLAMFIGVLIHVINKSADTNMIVHITSTIAMVVYFWITAIFSCLTSWMGFCFGNSARSYTPTKKLKIATNIVTFSNLGVVIFTAIPTILWLIFG
jgi:hypothetical protein